VLRLVLDYLASIDAAGIGELRQRIEDLLGQDADWENPAAMMDPTKSVGLSPRAVALRSSWVFAT
jgi:erythromycin esterase